LLHRRDAEENKIKPEGAEVAEAAETFGLGSERPGSGQKSFHHRVTEALRNAKKKGKT